MIVFLYNLFTRGKKDKNAREVSWAFMFLRGILMKKRLLALLMAALLMLGIFAGCTDSDNTGSTDPSVSTPDFVEVPIASPDESGAVISKIPGFTADTQSRGVNFPCEIEDNNLVITAFGSYTGDYVEDGDDEAVENIMAIVVQNTSDKPVQYATVTLNTAEDETTATSAEDTESSEKSSEYTFVLSTLPAGCSALVLESAKQTCDADTEFAGITASVTECDALSTKSDKVSINFEDGKLKLKNLTDTDYRAVYVRYKNFTDGNVFMGGITYNASFESVTASESYEYEPAHFFEDTSLILMVEIVE